MKSDEANGGYPRAGRCEYNGAREHCARDIIAGTERPEGSGSLKYVSGLLARRLARRWLGSRNRFWNCGRCAHRCCHSQLALLGRRIPNRLPICLRECSLSISPR